MHKVLIVGGGFGGIAAAQKLSKNPNVSVRLIDPKSYMEYHA
jgi:NADH dehydrogenase FAD-containing subunit